MAIALSIGASLLVGVTVMFQTQYFWGKEDNPNIKNINATITNLTASFGTANILTMIIVVVVALFVAMCLCTFRGF
jgi:ABC-type antimicrobial peptide transport system permease subunit